MTFSVYNVFIPIENYLGPNSENPTSTDALIEELLKTQKHLSIVQIEDVQYLPKIEYLEEFQTTSMEVFTPVPALKFSFDIPSIHPRFKKQYDQTDKDEIIHGIELFSKHKYASTIQSQFFCFLCLTQIAHPFSLQTYTGEIYIDGMHQLTIERLSNPLKSLFDSKPKQKKVFWRISIIQIYNWLSENEILFNQDSRNNIERMLYALTHIYYSGYDQYRILVWSMYALEAFYCNSNEKIQEQLRERVKIFLNNKQEFSKKALQNMYDFRSMFLHGLSNIKPASYDEDFINNSNPNYENMMPLLTSLSIVICSIQKLIALKIKSINFELIQYHNINSNPKLHN